ncbi:MAG: MBL fold metallo-hydrolase, partial [Thermoanaerobaculia bacterium]
PDRRRFLALALLASLSLTGLAGCGHVIRPELAPNHGRFNFSDPPCRLSPKPELGPGDVGLRYLGAGGLYIEWQGSALLMSPFFSNPGILQVPLGHLVPDAHAVREGLGGMDLSRVRAIAAGHSHYDHLGDLPLVATDYVPCVPLYVNRTGANALAATAVRDRTRILEDQPDWIYLKDERGNDLPIRFRKVPSKHAPHVWGILLASGQIHKPWTPPWEKHHLLCLKTGNTYAFVIELLSPADRRTLFRIYYQDAANPKGVGAPPGPRESYDLAVLCMASYIFVRDHPGSILGALKPRHVLVTHYEDFFRDRAYPVRFVFPLTDFLANRFLRRTRAALQGVAARGPENPRQVCGPSTSEWTMPMPGEWVRFRVGTAPPSPTSSAPY